MLFIQLDCFGASLRLWRYITHGDVCLLLNWSDVDSTRLTVLKVPKTKIHCFFKIHFKPQQQYLFQEIILKIIHRPFCEQFQLELSYFCITAQKEACNHYYCGVNGSSRNVFVFRWTVPFYTMIHFCCFPRLLYICFVNRFLICASTGALQIQYVMSLQSTYSKKWNWETAVVLSDRNCYIVWLDEFMQVEILKRAQKRENGYNAKQSKLH